MSGHTRTAKNSHGRGGGNTVSVPYARSLEQALRIIAREQHPRKPARKRLVRMPEFSFTK